MSGCCKSPFSAEYQQSIICTLYSCLLTIGLFSCVTAAMSPACGELTARNEASDDRLEPDTAPSDRRTGAITESDSGHTNVVTTSTRMDVCISGAQLSWSPSSAGQSDQLVRLSATQESSETSEAPVSGNYQQPALHEQTRRSPIASGGLDTCTRSGCVDLGGAESTDEAHGHVTPGWEHCQMEWQLRTVGLEGTGMSMINRDGNDASLAAPVLEVNESTQTRRAASLGYHEPTMSQGLNKGTGDNSGHLLYSDVSPGMKWSTFVF